MLKKFYVFLIFAMVLSVFSGGVLATEKGDEVAEVIEYKEIKDMDKLLKRAKEGKTDDKTKLTGKLINKETGEKQDIVVLATSQKIKTTKMKNGDVIDRYVATTFATIETDKLKDNKDKEDKKAKEGTVSISTVFGQETDPNGTYDQTISYKGFSKFYYDKYRQNGDTGYEMVDIISVEGSWEQVDSRVDHNSARYTIIQNGTTATGPYNYEKQYFDTFGLNFLRYVDNDSNYKPVVISFSHWVGLKTSINLTTSSSAWQFDLDNFISG